MIIVHHCSKLQVHKLRRIFSKLKPASETGGVPVWEAPEWVDAMDAAHGTADCDGRYPPRG